MSNAEEGLRAELAMLYVSLRCPAERPTGPRSNISLGHKFKHSSSLMEVFKPGCAGGIPH